MRVSLQLRTRESQRTATLAVAFVALALGMSSIADAGPGQNGTSATSSLQTLGVPSQNFVKRRVETTPSLELSPLPQVVATLKPNVNPQVFAAMYGLTISRVYPGNVVVLNTTFAAVPNLLQSFANRSEVIRSWQEYRSRPTRFQFTVNDPFYNFNNPSGFPGQWHLHNSSNLGGANIDVNAPDAWAANVTGSGVVVGIVDDGLERLHEDLSPNYSSVDSFDFGQNDSDPTPFYTDDDHGTAVSGVAGARGGNNLGVTGAAPLATLAGLRCDFAGGGTTTMFANATTHRSSGQNTQIKIKNHSYGYTAPYINTTTERDALVTSTNAGTIHVWAAGNSRQGSSPDSALAMLQGDPNAITVAALGANGIFSSYSNFGACIFVTAPSSGATGANSEVGITTTDRMSTVGYNPTFDTFPNNNYTSVFGGTSSASPLVAGVLALVKQSKPSLNTRFAKHLLVKSSDQVNASDATESSDGGWVTNAAGNKFNANYGFGNINVQKLLQNAPLYSGVTALSTTTVNTVNVNAAIPDGVTNNNPGAFVSRTFSVNSTTKLEEVQVTLNITHAYRGDIQAFLTSPSGTRSRLMLRNAGDSGDNINWTFTTNKFWGENPAGTWTIEVADYFPVDTGTWNSFSVVLRGGELITSGPALNAEFVNQSVPTTMFRGRPYTVSVTMRNNGTTPWTATDLYSLVSENPFSNSNFGSNRRDLNAGETVAPGASRTFTWTATAPATLGTFNFQWRMRKRSATIASFGDFSTNVPVNVIDGYDSAFNSQVIPAMVGAGQKFDIVVRMQNTGSLNWTFDNFRLVTMNPFLTTRWGVDNIPLASGETITPGGFKQFSRRVSAPATPGTHDMQWQMRRLGVANFGVLTPNVPVVVRTLNDSQFVSQTVNATMTAGSTQTVSVRFRNTGASTWSGSSFVLASMNPFLTNRWGISQVSLGGDTVAPDTEKTFTFNITAPTTPGTYAFQWQMRRSGNANFGPTSPNINITVN